MDAKTQEAIEKTVKEILETADLQEMTEYMLRKVAGERLNLDLSQPDPKKLVCRVVESFLQEQASKAAHENHSVVKEDDDQGDLVICQLSETRRVSIQKFRGMTLLSIREFYKKNGTFFPTTIGISLTAKQWSNLRKSILAIDEGIKKMKSRLH